MCNGRGVAWAANKLGQKAVVHMPKGSSQSRYDNIAREVAQVTIEDVNYDDCVRMAAAEAEQTEHGVIVQDTAWEGYEEIPSWIMQGYGTMASEAAEQLRQCEINRPTHVFVQAGVGSLAGAVVGYFANLFPSCPPKFVVMEASAADCLYQGALAGDGAPASSPATSRPSWPAWPAESPTPSPGTSCATTCPPLSPAPTGSAPRACACWACR